MNQNSTKEWLKKQKSNQNKIKDSNKLSNKEYQIKLMMIDLWWNLRESNQKSNKINPKNFKN